MSKVITLERLYKTFELVTDWQERYRFIIELGQKITKLDDGDKNDFNRVDGCMSTVHMLVSVTDDALPKLMFRAESDAAIVNGLIMVLHIIYDGKTLEEICGVDVNSIFDKLGLNSHLSSNRRNGFFSMVERLKSFVRRDDD